MKEALSTVYIPLIKKYVTDKTIEYVKILRQEDKTT